jgi:hypothetical protein
MTGEPRIQFSKAFSSLCEFRPSILPSKMASAQEADSNQCQFVDSEKTDSSIVITRLSQN